MIRTTCLLIFIFVLGLQHFLYAQPFIYYCHDYTDSLDGNDTQDTVFRCNLTTKEVIQFYFPGSLETIPNWDQSGTYVAINRYRDKVSIVQTSNAANHYDLPVYGGCTKLLYLPENNGLFFFNLGLPDGETLINYNLSSQKCESIIQLPIQDGYSNLYNREAFFSRDKSIIYFQEPDTTTEYFEGNKEILTYYSTQTKLVYKKQRLSEIFHPGAIDYSLFSGSNGTGVVLSVMDSLYNDCYYSIYDFDNSQLLGEIHCPGIPDPYIIGDNKYLALFTTDVDSSYNEFKTGSGSIYDIPSGAFIKNISLPRGEKIYRFDYYPDTLYYVKNLNGTPEVYTIKAGDLAQPKYISTLIPALAFPNSGSFMLEVTGKGFTSASKVLWNDSVRTTTFASDSLLRASILASDVATVGNKIVRVKYDSTSSALSDSMVFSVVNTLQKPVRLVIEKEIDNHNGTRTAWFGYLNVNDRSVYIPVGDKNSFSPAPIDRGQATIFLPGRHKYVFGVTFPNTINIEWQLNGRRAKAGSVCEN
jgi:hypothetical protein